MSEEKLSESEQRLFDSLENEMSPPVSLEGKILSQLKQEGLIKKDQPLKLYLRTAASIAAAVFIFISGIYFEKETEVTPISIDPERGYMLILFEDQNFKEGDPSEMSFEYGQWMQNTSQNGIKITGQELDQQAAVISENQTNMIEYDSKEKITGYFIIEANSLEDAVAIAENSPHIKYGGTIEVKTFSVR